MRSVFESSSSNHRRAWSSASPRRGGSACASASGDAGPLARCKVSRMMSSKSLPPFSRPRFMTDWSLHATSAPGSAIRTVRSSPSAVRRTTAVAVDAAQACESTCKRSVESSGRSVRSASLTSRTSTWTGPAGVATRTPEGPLACARPLPKSSSWGLADPLCAATCCFVTRARLANRAFACVT